MTQPSRSTAVEPGHKGASNKALIGILLAGTIGVIIFLFVHLSSNASSPTLTIGSKPAAASCAKGEHCLPDVNYVDTNGVAYSKASLAGKVVDQDRKPVPFATVRMKGKGPNAWMVSARQATSDKDGAFELRVEGGAVVELSQRVERRALARFV